MLGKFGVYVKVVLMMVMGIVAGGVGYVISKVKIRQWLPALLLLTSRVVHRGWQEENKGIDTRPHQPKSRPADFEALFKARF